MEDVGEHMRTSAPPIPITHSKWATYATAGGPAIHEHDGGVGKARLGSIRTLLVSDALPTFLVDVDVDRRRASVAGIGEANRALGVRFALTPFALVA